MSRESYARGFCKAAEAAGVDPKALAKFAQAKYYETGGRAPEGTPAAGSGRIPMLYVSGKVSSGNHPWNLWYQTQLDSPQIQALRNVPWFRNWHDAHTNVVSNLTKNMKEPSILDSFAPEALRALAEEYDKKMHVMTNKTDNVVNKVPKEMPKEK